MRKIKASKFKKQRTLLLVTAIIIPCITISIIGIISISHQKKSREIRVAEKYREDITKISNKIEAKTEQSIKAVFYKISNKNIKFNNNNSIQRALKDILVKYKIVKYPFFITSKGEFVFPFTKKTFPVTLNVSKRKIFNKNIKNIYVKGEELEFIERKFTDAIKYYLKCLKKSKNQEKSKLYIYNSIARCYFKLNKFPQAISYYNELYKNLYSKKNSDMSLYNNVIRHIALSYKLMGSMQEALYNYLHLYEEILKYEIFNNSERFNFLKNEALDYLNQYIPEGNLEEKRFTQAKAIDKLKKASKLDISLKWKYFEFNRNIEELQAEDKISQKLKFLKIQELYASTDEKMKFYKSIKNLKKWNEKKGSSFQFRKLSDNNSKFFNDIYIAFKRTYYNKQKFGDIFFGFMISPHFFKTRILTDIKEKNFYKSGVKLFFLDKNDIRTNLKDQYIFNLISIPFKKLFPEKSLALSSNQKNYFMRIVQKEMWINYGLIFALVIMLILGIYFSYKYISREAEIIRLKSEFVDSASHTLKTPLTRIRMLTEKIKLGWIMDKSKKEDYLETIIQETDFMSDMINNMLDFSKIESGKKEYEFKKGYIQDVLQNIVKQYSGYLKKLKFKFDVNIEKTLPPFFFDPNAIKIIIINLLQNSIKYSITHRYIEINLFKREFDALIEVKDRGIGIEEEDLQRIFEKFNRTNSSRVKTLEGSGLGLFLVQHAVKAHNGKIKVKSNLGKGTIFIVSIPINDKSKKGG